MLQNNSIKKNKNKFFVQICHKQHNSSIHYTLIVKKSYKILTQLIL